MTSTLIDQFFEAYMLYANETRGQGAQWRYLSSTRDIDPEGADSQGREYWDTWMAMLDETD